MAWQMHAQVRPAPETIAQRKQPNACVGLGTHMDASQWPEADLIVAYQNEARGEGDLRFRKDPLVCVSSWFVTQPARSPGLLLVMT